MTCKHCYFRNKDADEMLCRCRDGKCHYEEKSNKKKVIPNDR